DGGKIIEQLKGVKIGPRETAYTLMKKLAPLAANLLVKAVDKIATGTAQYRPQKGSTKPSAWLKDLEPREYVNWNAYPETVARQIRAFNFWPHIFAKTTIDDNEIIALTAAPCAGKFMGRIGEIIKIKFDVPLEDIPGKECRVKTRKGAVDVWLGTTNKKVLSKIKEGAVLGCSGSNVSSTTPRNTWPEGPTKKERQAPIPASRSRGLIILAVAAIVMGLGLVLAVVAHFYPEALQALKL
ncbi:unnamed protein product, partial [marine sediment metagenome]